MKVLLIDALSKRLSCKHKTILLTDKEFLLFECLSSHRGGSNIPVSRVVSYVWQGRESTIGRLNISQLIFRLRRKFELLGNRVEITFSMSAGITFHFLEKCIVLRNSHISRLLMALIP